MAVSQLCVLFRTKVGENTRLLKALPNLERSRLSLKTFNKSPRLLADIIAARIIMVALELLDDISLRCVDAHAHLSLPQGAGAMLLIDEDCYNAQVETEIDKIAAICRTNGATSPEVVRDRAHAKQLKEARHSTLAALAHRQPTTILEDITVPRSQLPEMVRRIRTIAGKHYVEMATFSYAEDGNLHPTRMTGARDDEDLARVEAAFDDIYQDALILGGTITGEHGVGLKKRHVLPKKVGDVGMAVMAAIKHTFEPNNILNPGKVIIV